MHRNFIQTFINRLDVLDLLFLKLFHPWFDFPTDLNL